MESVRTCRRASAHLDLMTWCRRTMTMGLLVTAPALWLGCGGGGDGGADLVQVNPPRVDVAGVRTSIATPEVQVTISPGLSGPVYVGAYLEGDGFEEPWVVLEGLTARVFFNLSPAIRPGIYTGALVVLVCADEACTRPLASSPYRVPYRLDLKDGLVHCEDVAIRVGGTTSLDETRRRVPVRTESGAVRPWTAESLAFGVVLDTDAGLTGGDLQFHVDPGGLTFLQNGTKSVGFIRIETQDPPSTDYLQVSLDLALPEIRQVTPQGLPASRPGSVLATGRGFTNDPALLARFAVSGLPDATAHYVSESQLRIDLPAAQPGAYPVTISNALGVPTSSATLRLVPPFTTARAFFRAYGSTQSLLWDDAHQALLVLSSGTMRPFYESGGTWSNSNGLMAVEMGLMPDGGEIFVAGAQSVGSMDPAHPSQSYSFPVHFPGDVYQTQLADGAPYLSAITADGRVWLQPNGRLGTYEPGEPKYVEDPSGVLPRNATAVNATTPRDGSRLYVKLSATQTAVPFVFMDSADWVWRRAPPGARYPDALSWRGERLLAGDEVFDASFEPVGLVPRTCRSSGSSYCYPPSARVFAPDGSRLYVVQSNDGTGSPKVVAIDTSRPALGELPILGYFEVLAGRGCESALDCQITPAATLTSDGGTLFVGSEQGVHVLPVPGTLLPWPPP